MSKKIFTFSKLSDQRWGIFHGEQLLATIGSQNEAKAMVRHLQGRLSTKPSIDVANLEESRLEESAEIVTQAVLPQANLVIPVSSQVSFQLSERNLATDLIS